MAHDAHAPVEDVAAQENGFGELRHYVPADLLDVTFPVAVRGYDRRTVDAYVERVNRAVAELKVSASPPAAVRHALEQAGRQVHGLLQSARQTAEEIISSARLEADESTARAKAESAELIVNTSTEADRLRAEADARVAEARADAGQIVGKAQAEAERIVAAAHADAEERLRVLAQELASLQRIAEDRQAEIEADADVVSGTRGELLGDIRKLAAQLVDFADAADERFPAPQAAEPLEVDETPALDDELRAAVADAAAVPEPT